MERKPPRRTRERILARQEAHHEVRLSREVEEPTRLNQHVVALQELDHPLVFALRARHAKHRVPARVGGEQRGPRAFVKP